MDILSTLLAAVAARIHSIKHIAIILDGNRRYTDKLGLKRELAHSLGFKKLTEAIKYCKALKIQTLTLFGLSIHNLKRSENELKCVNDVIEKEMTRHIHMEGDTKGVKFNYIGDFSHLPESLRNALESVNNVALEPDDLLVNFYYSYCSDDEASFASLRLKASLEKNVLIHEDELIGRFFMEMRGSETFNPEILVRTSGVKRLSDFMLWQVSEKTKIVFLDKMWPEFEAWDLIDIVLKHGCK